MKDAYIQRLEAEKSSLEMKIKSLQSEVRAINNLIYRRKSEFLADDLGEKKNLKNENRLFFESIILDLLNSSTNGLRTSGIYETLLRKGFNIKYNTLRSYVVGMRDKGKIKKKTKTSYYWIATKKADQ